MLPRIAIAQLNPAPGDIRGNTERMLSDVARARALGADIIVFPEAAISGYCLGDLNLSRRLVAESRRVLCERLAPATPGITLITGLLAPFEAATLNDGAAAAGNAFAVVRDGQVLQWGRKALLVDEGVLSDSRYFLPARAEEIRPVEVPTAAGPVRLGVLVCHDLWEDFSALKPVRLLEERGGELLVALNSSPYYLGKDRERQEVAGRRAQESGLPIVYANTVGVQDNGKNVILFDGGSFVMDARGQVAHRCPQFVEGLYIVPDPGAAAAAFADRIDELHAALRFGLAGFFARTGLTGAVIGLSGGIDSALNAVLLAQALGPANVLALNMPSRFSSEVTKANAAQLARNLGLEYLVHPIEESVQAQVRDYERLSGRAMQRLTLENLQARARGSLLMTYAQERGRLVIGNGNKTEFQRGYATMYGDLIGALMPLGDVVKTDVYRLAARVNAKLGRVIPQAAISIPPSAELSAEQDVNRGLGDPFDYDIEAPLGVELLERGRTPEEIAEAFRSHALDPEVWAPVRSTRTVYEKVTAEQLLAMAWETFRGIEATVFKRVQAPPILKVSKKAFGFDLRESVFARLRYE